MFGVDLDNTILLSTPPLSNHPNFGVHLVVVPVMLFVLFVGIKRCCIVLYCIPLRCVALRCVALRCVALRRVASRRGGLGAL